MEKLFENLSYALAVSLPDRGNLRETFFLDQLQLKHKVTCPKKGDFVVDERFTFEIGGKNKGNHQIKDQTHAFIVKDDLEYPVAGTLPLWVFGFLY